MFRFVWVVLLACSCGYAAPIVSAVANCPDGSTGGPGVWGATAQCGSAAIYNGDFHSGPSGGAAATVSWMHVFAGAEGSDAPGPGTWSAQADWSADFLLTFTGGTGSGMYNACILVYDDHYPGAENSSTSGSFGQSYISNYGKLSFNSCFVSPAAWAPFTFGVPQVVHSSFSASAWSLAHVGGPTQGQVWLQGIMTQVDGVTSMNTGYTLEQYVPEPASAATVLIALAALGALRLVTKPHPHSAG